jgi:hypothetical protein
MIQMQEEGGEKRRNVKKGEKNRGGVGHGGTIHPSWVASVAARRRSREGARGLTGREVGLVPSVAAKHSFPFPS